MKKKSIIFFTLFVTLLFAFTCTYDLFDQVREADFFSGKKYETRDIGNLYAEKRGSPDGVFLSVTLFSPFRDPSFECLPAHFWLSTHLVAIFSVLRC